MNHPGEGGSGASPAEGWRASALVLLSYLLLSAAFTWPAARLDLAELPTRHFDIYPVIWLIERGPETFPSMYHAASAWPYGESLVRLDSYILLWMSWLNQGLIPGVTLAALLAWWGLAISAWAAERCAWVTFHVPRPWSWIAGVIFAFSGIASNALLEGHVYHLLNPWMPLLLSACWRGVGPWGRARDGLWIGLYWALCLYTTAYIGIAGAILAAVVLLLNARRLPMLAPGMLVTILPAGLYYVSLFRLGGQWRGNAPFDPSLTLQNGTNTLLGLTSWTEEVDFVWHSLVAPAGFLGLWLWLLAPLILSDRFGWRSAWVTAALALCLSFGASVRLYPEGPGIATPLAALARVEALTFFRFPIRMMWLWSLMAGIMASRAVAVMVSRAAVSRGPQAGLAIGASLMLLVAVEPFWATGMPGRQAVALATTPSAYAAAPKDRATLDLYGAVLGRSSNEMEMRARVLSCYYQAHHRRPIFEVCIGTETSSPREALSGWLIAALLGERSAEEVIRTLQDVGAGAVALHTDTFRPGDLAGLQQALSRLFGLPATSTDGGDPLEVYRVPPPEDRQPNYRDGMKKIRGF